jgi:hypothetical protein
MRYCSNRHYEGWKLTYSQKHFFVYFTKNCKETWRTASAHLGKSPRGSSTKQNKYDLQQSMEFMRPYLNIKMEKPLLRNLPSPANTKHGGKLNESRTSACSEESCDEKFSHNTNYNKSHQQTSLQSWPFCGEW